MRGIQCFAQAMIYDQMSSQHCTKTKTGHTDQRFENMYLENMSNNLPSHSFFAYHTVWSRGQDKKNDVRTL